MIRRVFNHRQFLNSFGFSGPNKQDPNNKPYNMPHPIWPKEDLHKVPITHKEPLTFGDRFAHFSIQSLRMGFDVMSGYKKVFPWQSGEVSERKWINRVLFLETVAGVPGFVAGMHRHLRSLRAMKRDNGWIHTLLEEAENERMHLFTFLQIKKPTLLFRTGVILAQSWYVLLFSVAYMLFPRVCHRIVGYLEEEAVKTYTHMIEEIDKKNGPLSHWATTAASQHSIDYWRMDAKATLLDVVLAIRKDEEHHKDVNHKFADDYTQQGQNELPPGG